MSDDDSWGVKDTQTNQEEAPEEKQQQSVRGGRRQRGGKPQEQENQILQQIQKKEEKEEEKEKQEVSQQWIEQGDVKNQSAKKENQQENTRGNRRQSPHEAKVNKVSVQESISEVINPNATELQVEESFDKWGLGGTTEKKENNDVQESSNRRRGNRGAFRDDKEENKSGGFSAQTFNQNEGRGNRRGNRDNRDEDRGRNNNRGYNRDFNNQGNQFRREYNNQRGGRQGRQDRPYRRNNEEGGWNRNRNGQNRDRDQEGGNRYGGRGGRGGARVNRDRDDRNGGVQDNQAKHPKIQKVAPPIGGKAWPTCQVYVKGKKISVALRKVQDFNSKVLVVPYKDLKMEYYPGNFVASGKIDYRQKIKSKGAELQKAGSIYFQKALQISNYAVVVFLKVDDKDETSLSQSLQDGIQQILKKITQLQTSQIIDSMVFPLCQELIAPQKILRIFIKNIQMSKAIKQVCLATKDPKYFHTCMSDFSACIMQMLEQNEICYE